MKNNHILAKVALACCVIAAFILGASQLPKMSDVKMFANAQIQKKLIPYQQETAIARENAEKQRLIAEQWESNTRAVKAQQEAEIIKEQTRIKIEHIPQRDLIALGWGWALIVSFCAIMLCLGIGLTIAIVRFTTLHSDVFALALVSKRLTPGQERLELEKLRYLRKELEIWGISKDAPMLSEYKDITPTNTESLTAKTCLERGLMSGGNPSFFFGITPQGEHEYEDLLKGKTGQALIGAQGVGKSNDMLNTGVQGLLKRMLVLIIDLHFPDEESLTARFGPLADLPNIKYFSEHEDVIHVMYFLDTFIERRLKGILPKNPPVLVFIDELLNLIDLFRDEEPVLQMILRALKRVTTEGRKNNISLIAGSHSWKVQDIGSSTFRDNLLYRKAFRADKEQIRTLTKNKRLVNQCEKLQDGECVYMTPRGEIKRVYVPLWTPDAIRKAASMIPEVSWPDMEEPTQEDLNEYAQDVIRLDDYRSLSTEEILSRLSAMNLTQKEIARRSGLNEHTIGRILSRESEMQGGTKRKLMEVIA